MKVHWAPESLSMIVRKATPLPLVVAVHNGAQTLFVGKPG
jgi:hypothetical protein